MQTANEFFHELLYKTFPNSTIFRGFKNLLLDYLSTESGNILDVGCAQSPHIISMIEGDFKFWAIDKDSIALKYLKKRISDVHPEYLKKVQITVGELDEIIFDNTKYDGIILSHFLHFLEPAEYQNAVNLFVSFGKAGTLWHIKVHSKKHKHYKNVGKYFESFFDEADCIKLFPKDKFRWLYYSETYSAMSKGSAEFYRTCAEYNYQGQPNAEELVQKYLKANEDSWDIEMVIEQQ